MQMLVVNKQLRRPKKIFANIKFYIIEFCQFQFKIEYKFVYNHQKINTNREYIISFIYFSIHK